MGYPNLPAAAITAVLLFSVPAHATLVTDSIAVNIDRVYLTGDSNDIFCQPCGPNTVTYTFDTETNLPAAWSFDWWGDAGQAHLAFDAISAWGGPVTALTDEYAGYQYLYSDWTTVIDGWSTYRDFIYAVPGDQGEWFTADIGTEAIHADFTVPALTPLRGPQPSPVPEPGPFYVLAAALAFFSLWRATSRSRESAPEA